MADPVEQWLEESLYLPAKVQRSLRLMAELDASCAAAEKQMRIKEQNYLERLKELKDVGTSNLPKDMTSEYDSLKALQLYSQSLLKEKVVINRQISLFLHQEQQRLLAERENLMQMLNGNVPSTGNKSGSEVSAPSSFSLRGPIRRKGTERSLLGDMQYEAPKCIGEKQNAPTISSMAIFNRIVTSPEQNASHSKGPLSKCREQDERFKGSDAMSDVSAGTKTGRSRTQVSASAGLVSKAGSDVSVQNFTPSKKPKKASDSSNLLCTNPSVPATTAASSTTATPTESLQGENSVNYANAEKSTLKSEETVPNNNSNSKSAGSARRSVSTSGLPSTSQGSSSYKAGASSGEDGKRHSHGALETKRNSHSGALEERKAVGAQTKRISHSKGAHDRVMSNVGSGTDADPWEGICPVCHKGETSTEFINMVACDSCNHWFHFECVGYVAETRDEEAWFCTKCKPHGRN